MPLIEELPTNTTFRASHGWAYVPDTGPIAAIQPGNRDRKRVAASSRGPSASAKQQKAIQQRLESLDRENYRDGVNIPIPPRPAGRDGKSNKKTNTNVKRILMYQRTFAHYLADEETNTAIAAAIAAVPATSTTSNTAMPPPATPSTSQRAQTATSGRRKSALATEVSPAELTPPKPRPRGRPPKRGSLRASAGRKSLEKAAPAAKIEAEEDTTMTDAPAQISGQPDTSTTTEGGSSEAENQQQSDPTTAKPIQIQSEQEPPYDPSWDKDPLLASRDVPKMPSERVMQILLAEPPLSYTAARVKPLSEDLQLPKRNFCSICGYWGRVRCKKCEDWTCGLMECWRGHEGVCIMANAY